MQYRKRLFEKHSCRSDGRRLRGLCNCGLASLLQEGMLGVERAAGSAASPQSPGYDQGQLWYGAAVQPAWGWCEKKLSCWELSAFVQESRLSSVPRLSYTVRVPVPGCVHCWPWPCLSLVSWLHLGPALSLQTCLVTAGLWLTPVNATGPALLAQRLWDCVACLWGPCLPCFAPGPRLSSRAEVLLLPGMFWGLFSLLRINCCPVGLSVYENGQVCVGGWTCGNMWRGIILMGY